MKLDISSIVTTDGGRLTFQGESVFEPVAFCGNKFSFEKKTVIDGEIFNSAGVFLLKARVSGEVTTHCARCGKPVRENFSFELNEKLIKDGDESTEEDAICFSGDVIDIGDLAVNGFLMNSPARYLCKEDCKGLCPVCGINRNEKECSCEDDDIDPRLAVLNDLKF